MYLFLPFLFLSVVVGAVCTASFSLWGLRQSFFQFLGMLVANGFQLSPSLRIVLSRREWSGPKSCPLPGGSSYLSLVSVYMWRDKDPLPQRWEHTRAPHGIRWCFIVTTSRFTPFSANFAFLLTNRCCPLENSLKILLHTNLRFTVISQEIPWANIHVDLHIFHFICEYCFFVCRINFLLLELHLLNSFRQSLLSESPHFTLIWKMI